MLKVFVFKKRTLYAILMVLAIIIIGIIAFITTSHSDETFTEKMEYAYRTISHEQAKILMDKNPNLIVFDIRDKKDYSKGHLPHAEVISYEKLKKKLDDYNREDVYMIYGDNNRKNIKTAEQMVNNGFLKVYILKEGIETWPYTVE